MALLSIQVDLTRTANALERIAVALENYSLLSDPAARRLANRAQNPDPPNKSPGANRLFRRVTDEDLWQKEQDEEAARLSSQGLPSVLPDQQ